MKNFHPKYQKVKSHRSKKQQIKNNKKKLLKSCERLGSLIFMFATNRRLGSLSRASNWWHKTAKNHAQIVWWHNKIKKDSMTSGGLN